MQDLYRLFKDRILELGDIEIKFTKLYIAFTVNGSNFTEIEMQKKSFKMWLNLLWGELDDPLKIMRNVSKIGHHGNGDYEITVTDAKQIDYLLSLVKKVYDKK